MSDSIALVLVLVQSAEARSMSVARIVSYQGSVWGGILTAKTLCPQKINPKTTYVRR